VDFAAAGFDIVQRFPAHEVARELSLDALRVDGLVVGVLVGNTRALWPCIATRRATDAAFAASANPIEQYVEETLGSASSRVLFAHARYDGAFLPFQRIAVAAGLAALAPTQLLIHPVYGPWFALRAIVLCAGEAPARAPRVMQPCDCAAAGCTALFERAKQSPDDHRAWLAMRDACPIGREFRYDDDQIAYHYTKDARYLP
jgi:methylmalonic aciduria homocystinuria type C protein